MEQIRFFVEKMYQYGTKIKTQKGQRIFCGKEREKEMPILFLDKGVCALSSMTKKGEERTCLYFKSPRVICFLPYLTPEKLSNCHHDDIQICITAKTECVMYKLPETIFYQLTSENPEFIKYTMKILAENCIDMGQHLMQTQLENNEKKICRLLLEYSEWQDDKLIMPSYFTYEELANYLGIHAVTVARELLKLKASGYIGREKRLIQILNREALEKTVFGENET